MNRLIVLLAVPALFTAGAVLTSADLARANSAPVAASGLTIEDFLIDPADGLDKVEPEAFRATYIQYLHTLGDHTITANHLARTQVAKLELPSTEDLKVFIRLFPHPDRLLQLMEQQMDALPRSSQSEGGRQAVGSCSGPILFTPDYGSNTIGSEYQDVFLDFLFNRDFIPTNTSNTARCDNEEFASFTETLTILRVANSIGSAGCQLAGCDPTGIACAIVCGLDAIVDATTEIVELTEASCNAHNGTIDSAEIEAAYENSVIISGQVCVVDDKIDTLDGKIDFLLVEIAKVKDQNCEIIRLLHTPQGKRTTVGVGDCPPREWGSGNVESNTYQPR